MKRCIVIGAMPVQLDLKKYIREDDFVFCADGGYLQAEKIGVVPNMIIGDFDSAKKPADTTAFVLTLPAEKDDTDSFYIARQIVQNGYTDVLFCGVTGGRIEHTFANIQMLKYLSKNHVSATIMDKDSQMFVITSGTVTLPPYENHYFSVFSLDTLCQGVTIMGGKYPVDNAPLTNEYPVGISNEFMGKEVKIGVESGSLLIIITAKEGEYND